LSIFSYIGYRRKNVFGRKKLKQHRGIKQRIVSLVNSSQHHRRK
jgi:hypothetical protein